MGAEHAPETVWKAQELYCVDRLSFTRVAEMLGLANSTVRRWADKFHWREEREAIAEAESQIRANTVKGRAFALRKLLESETGKEVSQVAFAVASLERLALSAGRSDRKNMPDPAAAGPEASGVASGALSLPEGLEDADRIAFLEQAVDRQISYVLSGPVTDFSRRVREIKSALDVLASLRGKTANVIRVSFAED